MAGSSRFDEENRAGAMTGSVVFFMGLSGAGKTRLSRLTKAWISIRARTECGFDELDGVSPRFSLVLDGDDIRTVLPGLGFDANARIQQISRLAALGCVVAKQGGVCIVAAVNPLVEGRKAAKRICDSQGVANALVWVDAPLDVCEERCVHKVYEKYRAGECDMVAGLDFPFEQPLPSEGAIRVLNDGTTPWLATRFVLVGLRARSILPSTWNFGELD